MNHKQRLIIALIMLISAPLRLSGQDDISGLDIMRNVYTRPTGSDQQGRLTMSLTNSRGSRRVRKIEQFIKDTGQEEKKIMFFISPADVRNTSFMNWSYGEAGRDDDQWIYLPALKRIKRISSESKSDYFMGSDFTYDDLGERHPSEDTHTLLREETLDGEDCYIVESIPREDGYMYSRTVSWVIKDKWIGLKKEFYDEEGELLKVLRVLKQEKINGYWIITHTRMHNIQKDHTTEIRLENLIVDAGIPDSRFTERMMKRGL
ncbi:MAG TPA: outer membrane lipoprotein-sorting protein [bacterium]|nr:outer membrane lipoprotein-sorting protein [bacterium]